MKIILVLGLLYTVVVEDYGTGAVSSASIPSRHPRVHKSMGKGKWNKGTGPPSASEENKASLWKGRNHRLNFKRMEIPQNENSTILPDVDSVIWNATHAPTPPHQKEKISTGASPVVKKITQKLGAVGPVLKTSRQYDPDWDWRPEWWNEGVLRGVGGGWRPPTMTPQMGAPFGGCQPAPNGNKGLGNKVYKGRGTTTKSDYSNSYFYNPYLTGGGYPQSRPQGTWQPQQPNPSQFNKTTPIQNPYYPSQPTSGGYRPPQQSYPQQGTVQNPYYPSQPTSGWYQPSPAPQQQPYPQQGTVQNPYYPATPTSGWYPPPQQPQQPYPQQSTGPYVPPQPLPSGISIPVSGGYSPPPQQQPPPPSGGYPPPQQPPPSGSYPQQQAPPGLIPSGGYPPPQQQPPPSGGYPPQQQLPPGLLPDFYPQPQQPSGGPYPPPQSGPYPPPQSGQPDISWTISG